MTMNDILSQDELDALLGQMGNGDSSDEDKTKENPGSSSAENGQEFTSVELDALGEIGNISMGTAATTLFTLLNNNKVEITTPVVRETTIRKLVEEYELPFVSVFVKYSLGIEGVNLLILKEEDVKIITSLMLGGDGKTDVPEKLDDIHLSAISEAMNQMIGSSSTSLSEMIGETIDISPPKVSQVKIEDGGTLDTDMIDVDEKVMCTSFEMRVGNLIDSTIMQILPISFAKTLIDKMMGSTEVSVTENKEPKEEKIQEKEPKVIQENIVAEPEKKEEIQEQAQPVYNQNAYQGVPINNSIGAQTMYSQPNGQVNVRPIEFTSFNQPLYDPNQVPENIDLIKDVMLKITVELGQTVKPINEILDFQPGSILELNKLVGESLDILANGKKIASGEVVVIDENYGIRITDIEKSVKNKIS